MKKAKEKKEEKEEPRIGVFTCYCGSNIAGVVDCEKVREYAEKLPHVVCSKTNMYMCSDPGRNLIKESIKEYDLNRVVVASCSPRMHEPTFKRVIEEAGLNPYLFEMANIREHDSWVHSKSPHEATEKANDLVKMAVAKAALLEPLEKIESPVTQSALVIGAGTAGITAAYDIAESGFPVFLIEKEFYIGGKLAQLNKVFPHEKSALDLHGELVNKLSNPKIQLFTGSTVSHVTGYIGNFQATIVTQPRCVDESCNLCGECSKVCLVSVPNEFNQNLDTRKAIYLPFPECFPQQYVIDFDNCTKCGECLKVCDKNCIHLEDEPTEREVNIGTIVVATGFDTYNPDPGEFGYATFEDVITSMQLERMMNPNGPTRGKLINPSNFASPNTVVFISCVGSRQSPELFPEKEQINQYCSRTCCSLMIKDASLIKEKFPEKEIFVLYRDIRTFGKGQEKLYRKCRELGVNFVRYGEKELPKIVSDEHGNLIVGVKDHLFNVFMEIQTDLVVLATGAVPAAYMEDVCSILRLSKSPDGFLQEAHPKLAPFDTFSEGIYIAGAAQGPKDLTDTSNQASAAASRATIPLAKGKLLMDLVTAKVNEDLCIGCFKCVEVCPYQAIEKDEVKGKVNVIDAKCKACGICSGKCPVGAIQLRHFKDDQIINMIDGLLAVLERG